MSQSNVGLRTIISYGQLPSERNALNANWSLKNDGKSCGVILRAARGKKVGWCRDLSHLWKGSDIQYDKKNIGQHYTTRKHFKDFITFCKSHLIFMAWKCIIAIILLYSVQLLYTNISGLDFSKGTFSNRELFCVTTLALHEKIPKHRNVIDNANATGKISHLCYKEALQNLDLAASFTGSTVKR